MPFRLRKPLPNPYPISMMALAQNVDLMVFKLECFKSKLIKRHHISLVTAGAWLGEKRPLAELGQLLPLDLAFCSGGWVGFDN